MIFVAHFQALVDTDGTAQDFVFSTVPFVTNSAATPADARAYGRLLKPADYERTIAGGSSVSQSLTLFGATRASAGECLVANADGRFDALPTYGVAGQDFTLYVSDSPLLNHEAFPGAYYTVFVATMKSIVSDGQVLRINLKEKLWNFGLPICDTFTGAGGADGDAELAGTPKPRMWGGCFNVSPVLVNKERFIYMLSSSGNCSGHHARDQGVTIARQLTAGAQENDAAADFSALYALTMQTGHYATCMTDGVLRLAERPAGTLTCDAVSYASGVERTNPADVLLDIATAAVPSLSYNGGAILDLFYWADAADAKVGYYARDARTTYIDALATIASSIGAWCGFERDGDFTAKVVVDPSGVTSVMDITEDQVVSIRRVLSGDPGRGVPYANVIQQYPRNWTQQSSGFGAHVEDAARQQYAERFPLALATECTVASDAVPATQVPVATQFPGAIDYVVDSYGYARRKSTNADLEAFLPCPADTFTETIGAQRDWFEVALGATHDLLVALEIGDVVTVTHRRHGLSSGKKLMVVGIRYLLDPVKPSVSLTLWG